MLYINTVFTSLVPIEEGWVYISYYILVILFPVADNLWLDEPVALVLAYEG